MSVRAEQSRELPQERERAIRLLLVDDHAVVRTALANLLSFDGGFEIVGQADDGETALRLWHDKRPDICLLDITMAGIDGFETLRRLLEQDPDAKVLMLTSSDYHEDMTRAADAGARGYVTKTALYNELVAAIRTVHAGGKVFSHRLTKPQARQAFDPLTSRELEVLGLLRQGFTNAEIGNLLGVSERTARSHVEAIKSKLHCNHRAEAVARGFELGLLRINGVGRR
jgi:DNA-binding NarL/FixJ family response regulator